MQLNRDRPISDRPPAPARAGITATRTAPWIPCFGVPSFGAVRHDTKKSLWPRTHYLLQIREMATEQHLMKEAGARQRNLQQRKFVGQFGLP